MNLIPIPIIPRSNDSRIPSHPWLVTTFLTQKALPGLGLAAEELVNKGIIACMSLAVTV